MPPSAAVSEEDTAQRVQCAKEFGLPDGWQASTVTDQHGSTAYKFWAPDGTVLDGLTKLQARLGEATPAKLSSGGQAESAASAPGRPPASAEASTQGSKSGSRRIEDEDKILTAKAMGLPDGWRAYKRRNNTGGYSYRFWTPDGTVFMTLRELQVFMGDKFPADWGERQKFVPTKEPPTKEPYSGDVAALAGLDRVSSGVDEESKFARAAELGLPDGWRCVTRRNVMGGYNYRFWAPDGTPFGTVKQVREFLGDKFPADWGSHLVYAAGAASASAKTFQAGMAREDVPDPVDEEDDQVDDAARKRKAEELGLPEGWRARVKKNHSKGGHYYRFWTPDGTLFSTVKELRSFLGEATPPSLLSKTPSGAGSAEAVQVTSAAKPRPPPTPAETKAERKADRKAERKAEGKPQSKAERKALKKKKRKEEKKKKKEEKKSTNPQPKATAPAPAVKEKRKKEERETRKRPKGATPASAVKKEDGRKTLAAHGSGSTTAAASSSSSSSSSSSRSSSPEPRASAAVKEERTPAASQAPPRAAAVAPAAAAVATTPQGTGSSAVPRASATVGSLKPLWEKQYSEEYGINFWWNPVTGEACWEKPEGAI